MNIAHSAGNGALFDEIQQQASHHSCGLSFEEFMGLSLYHPIYGYYSRPRPIGKQGDFFTSVSAGPCFGELLARQIRQIYDAWGAPASFCVIEQGAHSGVLARDILGAWPGLPYRLVEPMDCLREFQCQTLQDLQADIRQVSSLRNLRETNAVFLCNELLDSFPVRRLHFSGSRWEEWRVVADRNTLRLRSYPLDETGFCLPGWVPAKAPEGFTLEICPGLAAWLADLTCAIERGVAIVVDYGLTREERLDPSRRGGTLRAYRGHRLVEDPLERPGETDLTWHIDFTGLIETALELGWKVEGFTDQARFLTGVAVPWLRSLEGQADHPLLTQFNTLTHPAIMGRSFRVLALSRNAGPLKLDGFQFTQTTAESVSPWAGSASWPDRGRDPRP